MPQFYRELDDNSYCVQQEAVKYALALDLVHNPVVPAYRSLDPNELIKAVPAITTFLEKYNIVPRYAGFVIADINSTSPIHIEQINPRSRLEIPVIGCEYSYTAYYSTGVLGKSKDLFNNEFWLCKEEGAVELERFTMTKPTIMRVDTPFRTRVTRVHIRRISLAVAPKNDITKLYLTNS